MSLILMTFSSTGRCQKSFCEYSVYLCQYFLLCGAQLATAAAYNPLTYLIIQRDFCSNVCAGTYLMEYINHRLRCSCSLKPNEQGISK